MLKNVILDFGGVVCGYNIDDIVSRFYDEDDRSLVRPILYRDWGALDAGTVDYDEYVETTLTLLPERLADTTKWFFRDWYKTMPPMEGTWALIGRLKARGYRVYLLSNAPTEFASGMDCFAILRIFDGLVISAPIQKIKPHADIFEYILEKYQLRADESLFVDDMPVNAEGAKACGLHAYTYDGDAEKLLSHIESLS